MGFVLFFIGVLVNMCTGVNTRHHQTIETESSLQKNDSKIFPKTFDQPLKELRNVHEFLEIQLARNISNFTLNSLTKAGDNYNSMLQALEVKFIKVNNSTEIETLSLVCKTTRPGSVSVRQSMQFLNEVNFYSDIIPAMEKFEAAANVPKNERIDAFVRYFGSRLSLNANVKSADSDAVLLLENAKSLNYFSPNRWDRLNEDEVLAFLKQLAKLHALCIAIRRLQPSLYYSKINPHLHTVYNDSYIETLIKRSQDFADDLPFAFPNMPTKMHVAISNYMTICKEFLRRTDRAPDTSYTTFYHRDLWTKNLMIKRDGAAGKSIDVIILDFQAYDYNSFALDLLHFLLSNARIDDLKVHFKSFIEYYIIEFVNIMHLVNCPLDDYTHDKMWTEIRDKAKFNLLNLYMYLASDKIALEDSNSISSQNNVDANDTHLQHSIPETILNRWKCINDLYIENGFISID